MSCVHLSSEDVLVLAEHACPDMRIVLRDAGLLESAAHRPPASMFGQEAYPDVLGKAAALLQSLAANRPFLDGSKRTAWLSCVAFLAMNGVDLRPDIDAAEHLVVAVATGETEIQVIAKGLRELVAGPV